MARHFEILILFLLIFAGREVFAQSELPNLEMSVQTDILAYTTLGGYSAWITTKYKKNKLSIAFVNYPNRFRNKYAETGIKETPRWLRFQLSRKFKSSSRLRNFHYGLNIEHHWRKLEEDNNISEILNDRHWQLGVFVGYDWRPWKNKESALGNLLITPWIGGNILPNNSKMARVFENTSSIYDVPDPFRPTIGINLAYTIFQN